MTFEALHLVVIGSLWFALGFIVRMMIDDKDKP